MCVNGIVVNTPECTWVKKRGSVLFFQTCSDCRGFLTLFNHSRANKNPKPLFLRTFINLGVGWVVACFPKGVGRRPVGTSRRVTQQPKTLVLLGFTTLHRTLGVRSTQPTFIFLFPE